VSAACYAVADLGKRVGLQELAIPGTLWVPLLLAGAGLVLLPSAIRNPPSVTRRDAPKFLAGGALVALGEHLTTVAFAALPASVASPVINTQAIIAVVLGGIVLGERYFRIRLVAALPRRRRRRDDRVVRVAAASDAAARDVATSDGP